MLKILKTASYISLLLFSQWSYCIEIPEEVYAKVLPVYCKFTQGAPNRLTDPSATKMWSERLGSDGFFHAHHYCWGLYDLYNAHKSLDQTNRNFLLGQAINEMQYVQKNAPPTFKLQPKISYDIGQIREELGDDTGAMQAYYQCVKLNPKIARPYAALSDLFKKQNNTKEALAILEQGLKYKPKSKVLLKRVALLSKEK